MSSVWESLIKPLSNEDFKEHEHPRADDGKFSSGGGSTSNRHKTSVNNYTWNGTPYNKLGINTLAQTFNKMNDPDRKKALQSEWQKRVKKGQVPDSIQGAYSFMNSSVVSGNKTPSTDMGETKGFKHVGKMKIKLNPTLQKRFPKNVGRFKKEWNSLPDDVKGLFNTIDFKRGHLNTSYRGDGLLELKVPEHGEELNYNFNRSVSNAKLEFLEKNRPEKLESFKKLAEQIGPINESVSNSKLTAEHIKRDTENDLKTADQTNKTLIYHYTERIKEMESSFARYTFNVISDKVEIGKQIFSDSDHHKFTVPDSDIKKLENAYKEMQDFTKSTESVWESLIKPTTEYGTPEGARKRRDRGGGGSKPTGYSRTPKTVKSKNSLGGKMNHADFDSAGRDFDSRFYNSKFNNDKYEKQNNQTVENVWNNMIAPLESDEYGTPEGSQKRTDRGGGRSDTKAISPFKDTNYSKQPSNSGGSGATTWSTRQGDSDVVGYKERVNPQSGKITDKSGYDNSNKSAPSKGRNYKRLEDRDKMDMNFRINPKSGKNIGKNREKVGDLGVDPRGKGAMTEAEIWESLIAPEYGTPEGARKRWSGKGSATPSETTIKNRRETWGRNEDADYAAVNKEYTSGGKNTKRPPHAFNKVIVDKRISSYPRGDILTSKGKYATPRVGTLHGAMNEAEVWDNMIQPVESDEYGTPEGAQKRWTGTGSSKPMSGNLPSHDKDKTTVNISRFNKHARRSDRSNSRPNLDTSGNHLSLFRNAMNEAKVWESLIEPIEEAGTSDGARKAWQTRHSGGGKSWQTGQRGGGKATPDESQDGSIYSSTRMPDNRRSRSSHVTHPYEGGFADPRTSARNPRTGERNYKIFAHPYNDVYSRGRGAMNEADLNDNEEGMLNELRDNEMEEQEKGKDETRDIAILDSILNETYNDPYLMHSRPDDLPNGRIITDNSYGTEGGWGSGKRDHKKWMTEMEVGGKWKECKNCKVITESNNGKCSLCGEKS